MSALGAIVMYIMSLLSLIRLRRIERDLARPYHTPLYPIFPLVAIAIATVSLLAIAYNNVAITALFLGIVGLGAFVLTGPSLCAPAVEVLSHTWPTLV